MTDSHAHLDACDVPPTELLERARSVGVTRVVTIGTGIDSCRRALAIADQPPKPGGGWDATVDSADASFSPSPLDDAPPITLFIQPCMGHAFCPFAPQSYVFAPAAALPGAF